ncbi:hypothetical protein J155_02160 [Xanthomonas citri pv. citri]|nr:hypothetical protein XAC29_10185 [Xanthomonas axonopodis Xac29-1]AJD68606.1 hypothetical protein J151_02170 [Xanthomonas citri subsp. citri A306]AJY82131.1 hypothetical protein J159_02158 [Xanthomonas citri pv. citri]AJY86554.1 hypothetical protein J158_02159 [Xanthomonas citri subsp. citri UI6]QYF44870.1 hypothetical protein HZS93_02172 [Xanthomonas citri]
MAGDALSATAWSRCVRRAHCRIYIASFNRRGEMTDAAECNASRFNDAGGYALDRLAATLARPR